MKPEVVALMPDDPLKRVAWRDCLIWVSGQEHFRERFEADTGMRLATSPLNALIDEATGYNTTVCTIFIIWFNENIWGEGND